MSEHNLKMVELIQTICPKTFQALFHPLAYFPITHESLLWQGFCTVFAININIILHSWSSYQACCEFLQNNNLLSIIRAHEAQDAG